MLDVIKETNMNNTSGHSTLKNACIFFFPVSMLGKNCPLCMLMMLIVVKSQMLAL